MARIICQALDEDGSVYLLKDDGILEKRDLSNTLLWSKQTKQEPTTNNFVFANQIALDIDKNVWLTYSDELNIVVRNTTDGEINTEVLGTSTNVITTQADGANMYALSTSRGLLHEISETTKAIVRSFDLTEKIPNYNLDTFVSQMTSSTTGVIYFGALTGGNITVPGGAAAPTRSQLVQFDPTGDGTFICYPITDDIPLQAVGSDNLNNIYVADLHGNIHRFVQLTTTFDAFYQPTGACGVVNIVTFTDSNEVVLVDDGTFAFGGGATRTFDPANGDQISIVKSSNVGTVCGDPLGYHHLKITNFSTPPAPIAPVFNATKITTTVLADGTIEMTGLPGAVTNGDTIQAELPGPTVIGNATINPDGSFSMFSTAGAGVPGGGESVTYTATFGAQNTVLVDTTVSRVVPSPVTVTLDTSEVIQTGTVTRLKVVLKDGSNNPITPATNQTLYLHLKHDTSGNYFNTSTFVPDNGNYLTLFHDFDGLWYIDVTLPDDFTGSATLFWQESPAVFQNVFINLPIAQQPTLESVKSEVEDLNSKVDIALGAPALSFDDPNTYGGFVVTMLSEIDRFVKRQFILTSGDGRAIRVERITSDVDRQTVFARTTPTIQIVVFDEERRFPKNLTGCRVFLNTKLAISAGVLVFSREGKIVDGPNGLAEVTLTEEDTAVDQRLAAQVVINCPGGEVLASPSFFLDILPSNVA